jgi:hypothetical protein
VGIFLSFAKATEGLTAAQAAAVPAPRLNSVWGIVNHVWFWQAATLKILRAETYLAAELGAPDESGWPPAGAFHNQAAWEVARQNALDANQELAAFTASRTDADLEQLVSSWNIPTHRAVQGIIAHNSYHTAEIITVRHIQGFWLEQT